MARPSDEQTPTKPGSRSRKPSSSGSSGVSDQIAQVNEQIEQEKLTQRQNVLAKEQAKTPILQAIGDLEISILEENKSTKEISLSIAKVRGETEGVRLTDAESTRDLQQNLSAIRAEFNEEKIARERRRLYEFEGVEA